MKLSDSFKIWYLNILEEIFEKCSVFLHLLKFSLFKILNNTFGDSYAKKVSVKIVFNFDFFSKNKLSR